MIRSVWFISIGYVAEFQINTYIFIVVFSPLVYYLKLKVLILYFQLYCILWQLNIPIMLVVSPRIYIYWIFWQITKLKSVAEFRCGISKMGQQHYIHFNVVSCVILHPTTIKYINSIIFYFLRCIFIGFFTNHKIKKRRGISLRNFKKWSINIVFIFVLFFCCVKAKKDDTKYIKTFDIYVTN